MPAVHAQLVSALSVVLHVRRLDRCRVVDSVGVVLGGPGRRPEVVPALWRADDGRRADQAAGRERLAELLGPGVLP